MKFHSPYTAPGLLPSSPLLQILLTELCLAYDVREIDVKSKYRHRELAAARQVYYYAASQHYPDLTNGQIGKLVQVKSSCVCRSITVGLNWILTDKKYRDGYNSVRKLLFPTMEELRNHQNNTGKTKRISNKNS